MIAALLALALAADCAECHKDEAAAMATSRHATAGVEPIFTVSFANAKSNWCQECHQPSPLSRGLTCRDCHERPGNRNAVVSTHPPKTTTPDLHPVLLDEAMGVSACKRCHQFNSPFLEGPMDPMVLSKLPMQSTVEDMLAYDPKMKCTDCHDPHQPRGAHDKATLRGAMHIKAVAVDGGTLLSITAVNTGHRFPTGDSFRRLVLRVCEDPDCARPVGETELGPYFRYVDRVFATQFDRTLKSGETRTFRFPPARFWRAKLFFGNPDFEAPLKPQDIFDDLGGGPVQGAP